MNEDDDSLDFDLGMHFSGLDQARAYEQTLASIVQQEKLLHNTVGKSNEVMREAERLRQSLGTMPGLGGGGSGGSSSYTAPPNARRNATEEEHVGDSLVKGARGAEELYKSAKGASGGMDRFLRVLWGVSGRLGYVVEGLTVAYGAAVAMVMPGANVQSARLHDQATAGGTTSDVAKLSLVGGNSQAARATQERITSDPMAMSAAAQLGVGNLKGIYGDLNWTRQYVKLIERTAAIGDDAQRRRFALMLGIEQEVAQFSLLSEDTKRSLAESARLSAQFSTPQMQKEAQEFAASMKMQSQAWDNLKAALSNLVVDDVTGVVQEVTKGINGVAQMVKNAKEAMKRWFPQTHFENPLGALTGGMIGASPNDKSPDTGEFWWRQDQQRRYKSFTGMMSGGRLGADPGEERPGERHPHMRMYADMMKLQAQAKASGGAASLDAFSGTSAESRRAPQLSAGMTALVVALQGNAEALNRLNQNIGMSARSREALGSNFGPQLHAARISGELRIGALG